MKSIPMALLIAALLLLAHGLMQPREHWTNVRAAAPGCVGDFVSRGLYCHRIDAQGNHIVTRAY